MKDNKDLLIEKQRELINHLYPHLKKGQVKDYHSWYDKKTQLESELSALQSVTEKMPTLSELLGLDKFNLTESQRNDCMSLANQYGTEAVIKQAEKFAKLQSDKAENEKYLNKCIEKATPNLSKIKDVDKELDEIRGSVTNDKAEGETKPKVICICGSGRFLKEMHEAEENMTLNGIIVLMIGVNTKDVARTKELEQYKPMLDELHLRKIDISDGVFIVNPGGYIGESTKKEIEYAKKIGKPIQYLYQQFPQK